VESISNYALQTQTAKSYDAAVELITNALQKEEFGMLTEIDVKATLKKKLDVDFRPYIILGACNPPFAHQALTAETQIGVLLPCNVVVSDEGDHRLVTAMDPRIMAMIIDKPEIHAVADEVYERIGRALKVFD